MNGQAISNTSNSINKNTRAVELANALRATLMAHPEHAKGKGIGEKGGFAWVTKEYIYAVHRRCHSLMNEQLQAQGSSLKLSQPNIAYTILFDAGFIRKIDNKLFSYCTIDKENWNKSLTLVCFHKNALDPNYEFPKSSMSITTLEDIVEKDSKDTEGYSEKNLTN